MQSVLISLDGNIGAGKTTLLEKFRKMKDVKVIDEPVDVWAYFRNGDKNLLQHFYEDTPRWAYTFQNAAILTRILHIRKTIEENPGYTFYITERSVLTDKRVFAAMLSKDGLLSEMEMQLYNLWFDNFARDIPDAVLWLATDVETCAERIKMRGRPGEENISREYLQKLDDAHRAWLENAGASAQSMKVVTVESSTPSDELYRHLQSCLEGIDNA
uniref:Deoxynucleoside kinase domain-containing protein n=1 Tax=viral metagenome TaxID=1070528 RepID=A0A6C0HK01_9ZZZZ